MRAFRARLGQGGCGINEYQDVEDFQRKLAQHLDQLLTRIRDARLAPQRARDLPWTGEPYPGLRPFEPEEAPIFFGRNDETSELVRWIAAEGRRFVAVVGVSGSGKSSLVKAGLVRGYRSGRAQSRGSLTPAATRSARSPDGSNRSCRHHAARHFGPIRRNSSRRSAGLTRFSMRSQRAPLC